MGNFNLGNAVTDELLNNNTCILCHKAGTSQYTEDVGVASYDYICKQCNPNVVIRLTDGVLMFGYLSTIRSSKEVREKLRDEITEYSSGVFKIDTELADYFSGRNANKPVTFHDWDAGN